jgi:hypothetical protein
MTTVGSSGPDALLGAVAVTLLVVMYGQWRYRSRRLQRCQERLKSRVAVVRELIADGERTQTAYAEASDPPSAHEGFLQRCDSSLREQFGDSLARRIDAYSEFEWTQPASLISDEQVFARARRSGDNVNRANRCLQPLTEGEPWSSTTH